MQHIIQKQILDVRLQNNERAIEKQQTIRKLYWERILPAMDKVFSELVPSNQTLRLEQLELNLGNVEMNDLEATILRQVKIQLSDALVEAEYKKENNFSINSKNTDDSELLIDQRTEFEAFLFFMKNGIYPWWFSAKAEKPALTDLWNTILQKDKIIFLNFLSTTKNQTVWTRLEKQFSANQLIQLIKNNKSGAIKEVQQLSELLSKGEIVFPLEITGNLISNTQWNIYIEQVLKKIICLSIKEEAKVNTVSSDFLIQAFIRAFIEKVKLNPRQFYTFLKKIVNTKKEQLNQKEVATLKYTVKQIEENFQEAKNEKIKEEGLSTLEKDDLNQNTKDRNSEQEEINKTKFNEEQTTKDKQEEQTRTNNEKQKSNIKKALEEGVYINNGGLVLLAPFLKMYFEKLGLIEQHKFSSLEQQERAVQLSYYLVTGNKELSENDCLLNKVICGWPIEKPIQKTFELNEKEEEESNALLNAVLQHWGGLGKSGIGALREGFLSREAKLIDASEQYKLIVERKTLDILMDKIPWSFRAVKLSWMEKRLLVEW